MSFRGVEHFFQRGYGAVAALYAEAAHLRERHFGGGAAVPGDALKVGVVVDDIVAVGGALDVDFASVGAERNGGTQSGDGIFGGLVSAAAVRDDTRCGVERKAFVEVARHQGGQRQRAEYRHEAKPRERYRIPRRSLWAVGNRNRDAFRVLAVKGGSPDNIERRHQQRHGPGQDGREQERSNRDEARRGDVRHPRE